MKTTGRPHYAVGLFCCLPMPAPMTIADTYTPPAGAGPPVRVTADPQREYVSTGGWSWGGRGMAGLRALPSPFDDLTTDFGPDIYAQMRRDPQIESAVQTLLMAALADPLQVTPARKAEEPDGALAARYADFCRTNLARLARPIEAVLYELGQALTCGSQVAEIIYEVATLPGGSGPQLVLAALKPKPPAQWRYVVDRYHNLIGLLYATPERGFSLTPAEDGTMPNLLPRPKFMHAAWRPAYDDPRGTSLLRAAYAAWWFKQQQWPGWLQFLATCAIPPLIGTTAENARQVVRTDGTRVSAQQAQVDELIKLRNGAVVSLPHGNTVEPLEVVGEGQVFVTALELANREMVQAILGATRATQEAQHGSRADSETGQDVLGLGVGYVKGWLETLVGTDLFAPLLMLNYGPEALALLPQAQLGDTAREDFAANATAVAQLQRAGYFHRSQLAEMDARLGLPVRDAEQVEADYQAGQAALAAASADEEEEDAEEGPG